MAFSAGRRKIACKDISIDFLVLQELHIARILFTHLVLIFYSFISTFIILGIHYIYCTVLAGGPARSGWRYPVTGQLAIRFLYDRMCINKVESGKDQRQI